MQAIANYTLPTHLAEALTKRGVTVTVSKDLRAEQAEWLLLEAEPHLKPSEQQVEAWMKMVSDGGSLLLSMSANPGPAPLLLAAMLPTLPWSTRTYIQLWAPRGSAKTGWQDK